jgi:hypothetical protein
VDDEFFLRTEWKRYINQQYTKQMKQIKMALQAQESALNELKRDNERFFFKAIHNNFIDSNSPIIQQVIERAFFISKADWSNFCYRKPSF